MFRKVLVANRGAIACRIIRTLKRMGVGSVAVYSEADRHSLHVEQADEAVLIGPAAAAQSYLSIPAILDAAQKTGAEAIHPGYGFLSENAAFAEACAERGVVFIGPTPEQMRAFGLKHTARRIAEENRVALLPGSGLLASLEEAFAEAERVGYPVMLKSTAGGGGIGMRLCASADELGESYAAVQRTSQASFGSAALYLEKFVANARHIEVQIFGDGSEVIALGERDCSAQRRNQKVIEETPAPGLSETVRSELFECAVRLGRSVGYRSAGTVEFIYDNDTAKFYFLEVNTRLQVEHGVTEEVTGIDLVEWMVRIAAGEHRLKPVLPAGCSMQVRVYAEDPHKNFQPSAGKLTHVVWPDNARVETWVESGSEVTPYYDPMLAKIIVRGVDRAEALSKMREALAACRIAGIETNVEYLRQVCEDPVFAAGGVTTSYLKTFDYRTNAIDVIEPGTQTTIQDYPGRLGFWHVGVPPSGPMDALAFRSANELVGNDESAAGLEIAVTGPSLRFRADAVIALTGADFGARLDGVDVAPWTAITVRKDSLLEVGTGGGRAYLSVAGGFDVPEYLGSKGTFILGKFGGHAGRGLRAGDVLAIGSTSRMKGQLPPKLAAPLYGNEWVIGAMYGPHGAPDFFTPEDIEMFFSTSWKVHYNSDRTGVRLIGPKPVWARKDGGEAGLHPSNIHDNAYAIGTVDFTGDMPVILGPDGPSLGGFVCPATIVHAELWKIGQLKPGDLVRFVAVSETQEPIREEPVLRRNSERAVRSAGDRYLLVEYGPIVLDMNLRIRVHALETELRAAQIGGIVDITAGVRSLQVHYDTSRLSREVLLRTLDECERRIPNLEDIVVPSRVVHLPLSWEDPATLLAIQKYMQSVRADAPWCPSNIEFIRRINGLGSVDDVRRIVYNANYLVLGLGDVYLGAPVATPTDPRHRLVTTKYNPARTWTPENAVGIGGAYMCVYGMEGPGGYQFVGRTVQMWSTYAKGQVGDLPYLLRNFDQIRFHPVSAEELLEFRDAFPHGRYSLKIEAEEFRLREYHAFLASIQDEARGWKDRQQRAFLEERERWGAEKFAEVVDAGAAVVEDALPEGCRAVSSPVTASVWNIGVEPGQRVDAGQRLIVLEAMKMEIAVTAPVSGVVEKIYCAAGALVSAGQTLVAIRKGS